MKQEVINTLTAVKVGTMKWGDCFLFERFDAKYWMVVNCFDTLHTRNVDMIEQVGVVCLDTGFFQMIRSTTPVFPVNDIRYVVTR